MYVAITRAQDHLFMSYAKSRLQRWQIKNNPVSRFVDELPEHLVKMYDLSGASGYVPEKSKNWDEWDRVAHKLFWSWRIMEVWDQVCIVKFDNPKFGLRKMNGKRLKSS